MASATKAGLITADHGGRLAARKRSWHSRSCRCGSVIRCHQCPMSSSVSSMWPMVSTEQPDGIGRQALNDQARSRGEHCLSGGRALALAVSWVEGASVTDHYSLARKCLPSYNLRQDSAIPDFGLRGRPWGGQSRIAHVLENALMALLNSCDARNCR